MRVCIQSLCLTDRSNILDLFIYRTPPRAGYAQASEQAGGGTTDSVLLPARNRADVVRVEARRNKDFALADALRQQLSDIGVTVDDKARTWHLVANDT